MGKFKDEDQTEGTWKARENGVISKRQVVWVRSEECARPFAMRDHVEQTKYNVWLKEKF